MTDAPSAGRWRAGWQVVPQSDGAPSSEVGAETTAETDPAAPGAPARSTTPTRLSATWTAVVVAVILMIALVVFVAQNTQPSAINFLGLHGRAPTAVLVLIAAVVGAVIVAVVAVARLVQLRRTSGDPSAADHHVGSPAD